VNDPDRHLHDLVTDDLVDVVGRQIGRQSGRMDLFLADDSRVVAEAAVRHLMAVDGWRPPEPMTEWLLKTMRTSVEWTNQEHERLLGVLRWLVSLDDPDPESDGFRDRRTVTLAKIIDLARQAVYPVREVEPPDEYKTFLVLKRAYWTELELRLKAWEEMPFDQRPWGVLTAVLWAFEADGGAGPGAFTRHLLDAVSSADENNRQQMFKAFPDLVTAYRIAEMEDGLPRLSKLVQP
jgi:hypothetical protein